MIFPDGASAERTLWRGCGSPTMVILMLLATVAIPGRREKRRKEEGKREKDRRPGIATAYL